MDVKHSQNANKRPKRRKDKDNPYKIFTVGIETENPRYYLSFTDGNGITHCIEITKQLFEIFDRFELEDLSHLNEVDRHIEHSEQTELSLNAKGKLIESSAEETVLRNEDYITLHKAIQKLPPKQKRRLILYYFKGLSYEEIGQIEGCTFQAVGNSIAKAEKNLKKFLLGG